MLSRQTLAYKGTKEVLVVRGEVYLLGRYAFLGEILSLKFGLGSLPRAIIPVEHYEQAFLHCLSILGAWNRPISTR